MFTDYRIYKSKQPSISLFQTVFYSTRISKKKYNNKHNGMTNLFKCFEETNIFLERNKIRKLVEWSIEYFFGNNPKITLRKNIWKFSQISNPGIFLNPLNILNILLIKNMPSVRKQIKLLIMSVSLLSLYGFNMLVRGSHNLNDNYDVDFD